MTCTPIGDRVLLKPIEAPKVSEGGIILPANLREKSKPQQRATVVALGAGNKRPHEVAVGDTVLVPQFGGNKVQLDGEDFILMETDALEAVLTE